MNEWLVRLEATDIGDVTWKISVVNKIKKERESDLEFEFLLLWQYG